MKKFERKQAEKIETMIGQGTLIEGNVKGINSLLINGTITGNVSTEMTIRVGTTGIIKGNVKANSALIGGVIEGDLDAQESAVLGPKSRLMGDLKTARLKIEEGATFEGRSVMLSKNGDSDSDEKELDEGEPNFKIKMS
ncbi:MAG: polymer-forming cytoskeletal protein [Candidatus Marinimicrobia bacterium]|nr:polymer-forming cytoskeletal protein [Candidatus Neomarinimicrobiota bacterium]